MEFLWSIFKIIFWITLTFAILHAIVTYFVFFYEMRLTSLKNNTPFSLSPFVFIKSFFIEIFCNFTRIWLIPFLGFPYQSALHTLDSDHAQLPILLVHGYGQNQMDWIWFRHQLKKRQVGPLYAINLSPAFASISELAELLKPKIQSIQKETGQNRIILIGHSMGGLVSSYYAEFLAPQETIAGIITLASPLQGTTLSALGYGKNVSEMAPDSPFLKTLLERIKHSHIPYHHVGSTLDNIVVPWQSAFPILNNDNNQLILEDHGHLKVLISPQVIAKVTDWIKTLNP